MPAPSTYIDITSFPFSRVVTVAEFNAGTFGGTANEVWFRYIAGADEVFAINPNFENNFSATTRIYNSDASVVLTSTTNSASIGKTSISGTTYFIRIFKSPFGAIASNFTVTSDIRPYLVGTPSLGINIVNDDIIPNPATILDPITGEVLGFTRPSNDTPGSYIAGEFGNIVTSGYALIVSELDVTKLYDPNGEFISNITIPGGGEAIASRGNLFYVSNNGEIYTVTVGGIVTLIATFSPFVNISGFGISQDGNYIYYTTINSGDINRWHIPTDTSAGVLYTMSEFTPGIGDTVGKTINGFDTGEYISFSDGSFVVFWIDWNNIKTHLYQISAAGVLVNHQIVDNYLFDHLQKSPLGDGFVSLWLQDFGQTEGKFGQYDLSTGMFITSYTVGMFSNLESPSGTIYRTSLFGPTQSCIFLVYENNAIGPTTGDLTVVKVTVPSGSPTVFSFEAVGVSPTDFTLTDTDSITYTGLTPGTGYEILEVNIPSEYDVTYEVSNGSPIDAIEIVAGETTIVTVTNTLNNITPPALRSGIYKIVPGKRNDTLWDADFVGTTDVKIP